jgi:valyl-tRNA synthetase
MLAKYPTPAAVWHNPAASAQMDLVKECITNARSMRVQYSIANHVKTDFFYRAENADTRRALENQADDFCTLAKGNFFRAVDDSTPSGCSVKVVSDEVSILVNLSGVVDAEQEIVRLTRDLEKTLQLNEALQRKLEAAGYADKVPDAVKKQNSDKLAQYATEIQNIQTAIAEFQASR